MRRPPFELLESLLFEPDNGLFLLSYHLDRLADSAEYFGIALDLAELRRRLQLAVVPLTTHTKLRVWWRNPARSRWRRHHSHHSAM